MSRKNTLPIKIIGSNHVISLSEIDAVLKNKSGGTRLAVEHILSLVQTNTEKYSPKSFIDSPETALQTLELLFQGHTDIFDKRKLSKAKKIVLSIMVLLSEYHENSQKYNSHISRDPVEQKELYKGQQRLSDTFHFLVGNMIDNTYDVSAQFGDIEISDITQNEANLKHIETSSEFPNVRRVLQTFAHIDFGDEVSPKEEYKKAA